MKKRNYLLILVATVIGTSAVVGQTEMVQQAVEPVIQYVPNYQKNLNLFIGLSIVALVQLVAIGMIAYSIKTMLASDYYRERLLKKKEEQEEKNGPSIKTIISIVVIGLFMAIQNDAMALSFKIEEGDKPWIRVENSDVMLLLVLNFVILGVMLYLRRMFTQIVNAVKLESEYKKAPAKSKALRTFNRAMTDIVPIEQEDKIILDHEFDGIRELDNNLPPWWIILFFLTIAFGVCYLFHYHILGTGDLQGKEYVKEMKQAEQEVQEYLSKMAMNVDETNATIMEEESDISAGKSIFANNCAVCHSEKGEGNIGPNLTDDYWLYTSEIKAVFRTIKFGTANGMPEHASKLNPIQIQQVASFILQLPYAAGKEPEGEKIENADE